MNKSLLALAVAATAATSVNAATVYDKDGTTFDVGGRVQAVLYNGNTSGIAEHDAGLNNSARLNLGGNTKINDFVSAFAFTEWDMADGVAGDDSLSTRDQYVGVDFGAFGKLLAGKTFDAVYAVQAATDVFEDFACVANPTSGDRRSGQFRYIYDNNGFFASAALQTAQDKVKVFGDYAYDVDSGFSTSAGYTFDNVVFGPLSFKAGYSYLNGQSGNDVNNYAPDDYKNIAASVTWGSLDSGLYVAGLYNVFRTKTRLPLSNSSHTDYAKGYELVVGYAFDCGVTAIAGYEVNDVKTKVGSIKSDSEIVRRIPVYVNYAANASFNVWAEAEFDANSSDNTKDYKGGESDVGTKFSVGARYTF
ncbi:MAG: porin [Succinivibrio sp.]